MEFTVRSSHPTGVVDRPVMVVDPVTAVPLYVAVPWREWVASQNAPVPPDDETTRINPSETAAQLARDVVAGRIASFDEAHDVFEAETGEKVDHVTFLRTVNGTYTPPEPSPARATKKTRRNRKFTPEHVARMEQLGRDVVAGKYNGLDAARFAFQNESGMTVSAVTFGNYARFNRARAEAELFKAGVELPAPQPYRPPPTSTPAPPFVSSRGVDNYTVCTKAEKERMAQLGVDVAFGKIKTKTEAWRIFQAETGRIVSKCTFFKYSVYALKSAKAGTTAEQAAQLRNSRASLAAAATAAPVRHDPAPFEVEPESAPGVRDEDPFGKRLT